MVTHPLAPSVSAFFIVVFIVVSDYIGIASASPHGWANATLYPYHMGQPALFQ